MSSMMVGASVAYAASPTPTNTRATSIVVTSVASPVANVAMLHTPTPSAISPLREPRSARAPNHGDVTK